ncbi:glycosyltransferase involved in cell wall biosynthesis [Pedobacter sp. UYP24]
MIIHIIPAYKPAYIYGGPTISVAALCEGLVYANQDLVVFTTTANGIKEIDVPPGIPLLVDSVEVYYFRRSIKGQTHFSFQLLKKLFYDINKKDTVVHIHSWWNATAILSCFLSIIKGRKVILSPRGMITPYSFKNRHFPIKWLFHKIIGKILIDYCKIHVTTEKEKKDVLKIQLHNDITVIGNLIDNLPIALKKEKNPIKQNGMIKLFFLSRIEEKKGIELLFLALSELNIPWRLTLCGSGNEDYLNKLKDISKNLKIDTRITWSGFIERTEKYRNFQQHDLLVLFSKNENFANVVIESLNAGIPVCISKEVGLANFIIKNDLGWVADLTKESIKIELTSAYYGYNKRKFITQNAPLIIQQHFHADVLIPKYIDLYRL